MKQHNHSRRFHQAIPNRSISRLRIVILISICLLLLVGSLFMHLHGLGKKSVPDSPLFVSITTTSDRLHYELQLTIASLLRQVPRVPPIRIYIPQSSAAAFSEYIQTHPKSPLANPKVTVIPSIDYGPSTKYIPAILESNNSYINSNSNNNNAPLSKTPSAILVCDDDHVYGSTIVHDLHTHFLADPTKAYGLRGWRIRRDLQWGVDYHEQKWHILFGTMISAPYRVGVLTANQCYMINPSWFHASNDTLKSMTEEYADAPVGASLVDDIWMNGHLARLRIQRWLVPGRTVSVDISRKKTLTDKMEAARVDRGEANDRTLLYFGDAFGREAIPYVMHADDVLGKSGPVWKGWVWTKVWVPVNEWVVAVRALMGVV